MNINWRASYLLREMAYDLGRLSLRERLEAAGVALLAYAFLWVLCAWAAM